MNEPPVGWSTSPAMGAVIARLAELYARALRVETALRARRMERLACLIERKPTR